MLNIDNDVMHRSCPTRSSHVPSGAIAIDRVVNAVVAGVAVGDTVGVVIGVVVGATAPGAEHKDGD